MKALSLLFLMIVLSPNSRGQQELSVSKYTISAVPTTIGEQSSHEKLEWFSGEKTYLLTAIVTKNKEQKTVLYSINSQRENIVRELPVPKNQTLQIDNLVPLDNGFIFMQGFFYCNKKPQKRLKNWYAIVNREAEIVRQKKTKYKKYQEVTNWGETEVTLLHNELKDGRYTNRPQVDFIDLKTLKVVKSIVLEYPETHAFINNLIEIDTASKQLLVIGMQTAVLPNADTLTYAKNILCTFDNNGKYIKNLLEDDEKEYFEITDESVAIQTNEHEEAMLRVSSVLVYEDIRHGPMGIQYNLWKGKEVHVSVIHSISGKEHIYCGSEKESLIIMGGYQEEEDKKYPYFTIYSSLAMNYDTGIVGYDLMNTLFYKNNNENAYEALKQYVGEDAPYNGKVVLLKIIEETEERMLCRMVLQYSPIEGDTAKVLIELEVEFEYGETIYEYIEDEEK
jgi:hypothetical protein